MSVSIVTYIQKWNHNATKKLVFVRIFVVYRNHKWLMNVPNSTVEKTKVYCGSLF